MTVNTFKIPIVAAHFVEGSSDKFYIHIKLSRFRPGDDFCVYGRVGTSGSLAWYGPSHADRKMNEKTKKGYRIKDFTDRNFLSTRGTIRSEIERMATGHGWTPIEVQFESGYVELRCELQDGTNAADPQTSHHTVSPAAKDVAWDHGDW
jgi:predicted DNA-binding WGR domain protein